MPARTRSVCSPSVGGRVTISPGVTDSRTAARATGAGFGSGLPDGPLLVVDDTYRSGWTMTVAAALLRQAGATSVVPLVVHQLP